jgi:hypothetical protein
MSLIVCYVLSSYGVGPSFGRFLHNRTMVRSVARVFVRQTTHKQLRQPVLQGFIEKTKTTSTRIRSCRNRPSNAVDLPDLRWE